MLGFAAQDALSILEDHLSNFLDSSNLQAHHETVCALRHKPTLHLSQVATEGADLLALRYPSCKDRSPPAWSHVVYELAGIDG